jgi:hypothetical protein
MKKTPRLGPVDGLSIGKPYGVTQDLSWRGEPKFAGWNHVAHSRRIDGFDTPREQVRGRVPCRMRRIRTGVLDYSGSHTRLVLLESGLAW